MPTLIVAIILVQGRWRFEPEFYGSFKYDFLISSRADKNPFVYVVSLQSVSAKKMLLSRLS